MKMKSKFLLLAITIFVSENSLAEKKIKMTSTNQYDSYLLKDIKQIKPNVYRFWMEVITKEDIYKETELVNRKGEFTKSLNEMDCNQETLKFISKTIYNEDGSQILSFTRKADQIETNYIVPNSYGELYMKQICNLGNKR